MSRAIAVATPTTKGPPNDAIASILSAVPVYPSCCVYVLYVHNACKDLKLCCNC
jgi:hypothetical protein